MTTTIDELKNLGLVNVNYPDDLREAVEKAVDSWKNFCQLSREDKCAFTFLEDNHGDGCGFELKEERGSKKDLKENFHVTLFQHLRLSQIANTRTFPFLNDAKTLLDKIEPLVIQFAKEIEEEYNIQGLAKDVQLSKPYWILRYLHYFGDQESGCEIAAPHADKGGFTLHLFESDEGLEYYCIQEKVWKPMPVDEKQTVIIPAAQLQLWSKGALKALYHRVVANEKTALTGRFSMVCFIPFDSLPKYNKKAYGSMQTHETGFNYTISHEDYAKLFTLHV
jgi:isopenicillin N synthase-like dioxygenase